MRGMTLVLLLKKSVRRCARKGGRVLHLGLLNEAAFCPHPPMVVNKPIASVTLMARERTFMRKCSGKAWPQFFGHARAPCNLVELHVMGLRRPFLDQDQILGRRIDLAQIPAQQACASRVHRLL